MALNRLHLVNFRKHEDTRIDLTSDAQIIAVTGNNGMGKSTLLTEALLWALYGESRHGRVRLDSLVRWGAEHEGMQVELEFTVGNTDYRVVRRLEKKKHSAQLYANENLRVQTANGVTDEVTRILGMDSVGFKLAHIAKQKELDGLTNMTPAVRKAVLTRLLRLDAIQTAAQDARNRFNRQREIADAMNGGPTIEVRQAELDAALTDQQEADAALAQTREALQHIDAQLAETADVERAHTDATIAVARHTATADAAAAEVSRLEADLASIVVPEEMAEPERSLDAVAADIVENDALIARGEVAATVAQQARHTRAELEKVTARIAEIDQLIGADSPASLAMAIGAVNTEQAAADQQRAEATERHAELLREHGIADGRVADLTRRLDAGDALGDVCTTCEQEIPDSHKHAQHERLTAELTQAKADVQSIITRGKAVSTELEELAEASRARSEKLRTLSSRQTEVGSLYREQDDARARQRAYTDQLERLVVEEVDLDAAFARKGALACEKVEVEAFLSNAVARQAALARVQELTAKVEAAQQRATAARQLVDSSAPDAGLLEAYARRQKVAAEREDERALAEACASAAAAAAERVAGARRLLDDAHRAADRVASHRTEAEVAGKAHRLLSEVSARMTTQIRPALEGQISAVLQTMSEGRFSAVKVADDYGITVRDHDGRFHSVSDLSGGEGDLVALAIRLALAQVVSARHGVGGAGFLVLDEVFGSQDEGRRRAILEGLRRLRRTYGQILLVSHVGGIEDAADLVLDVHPDEDEPAIARVSAS